jgi:hypothetical protein
VGFSRPFRSLTLPNDAVRILAEPSNNSNLCGLRQLFGPILLVNCQFAQAKMQVPSPQVGGELVMLGFSNDIC